MKIGKMAQKDTNGKWAQIYFQAHSPYQKTKKKVGIAKLFCPVVTLMVTDGYRETFNDTKFDKIK